MRDAKGQPDTQHRKERSRWLPLGSGCRDSLSLGTSSPGADPQGVDPVKAVLLPTVATPASRGAPDVTGMPEARPSSRKQLSLHLHLSLSDD